MGKRSSFSCWCASFVHRTPAKCLLWRQSRRIQKSSDMHALKRISWRKSDMWVTKLSVGWENHENLPESFLQSQTSCIPTLLQHYLALCTKNLIYHFLVTGQDLSCIVENVRLPAHQLNWFEYRQGEWRLILIFTLQCDRLNSIQLRYQQLYRCNIKLCHIEKISNQFYTFYVTSLVLSTQRKWWTQILLSSLCWSSWREVTSQDVCVQTSCQRRNT